MANPLLGYWYRLYTKQTECEEILEAEICKLKKRYRTQHIVMSCNAILDFYFPDYALAVEVDDPGHLKPEKVKKDKERTAKLNAKGIEVMRFTNNEVRTDLSTVLERLCRRLDALQKSPSPQDSRTSDSTRPKRTATKKSGHRLRRAVQVAKLENPDSPELWISLEEARRQSTE